MATSNSNNKDILQKYSAKFQSLRRAPGPEQPRPHKPVMLLAVLSLADNGQLLNNMIFYAEELLELFKRYFDVVRLPTDQCTPLNPFFRMKSEGFWQLHAVRGQEAIVAAMRDPGGVGFLMANVAYASLDNDLFNLISQPATREALRIAIIEQYFDKHKAALLALCGEESSIGKVREEWRDCEYQVGRADAGDISKPVRSAVFARTVRKAYDYRCAACGIRFRYENVTLIDAAHLIPFNKTPDNSPQNGLALCKNHHWLMDCNMLAPGPGIRNNYNKPQWYIRDGLDDRIEGQRELIELNKRKLILPNDSRLHPKAEALDCRMEMLKEACL